MDSISTWKSKSSRDQPLEADSGQWLLLRVKTGVEITPSSSAGQTTRNSTSVFPRVIPLLMSTNLVVEAPTKYGLVKVAPNEGLPNPGPWKDPPDRAPNLDY